MAAFPLPETGRPGAQRRGAGGVSLTRTRWICALGLLCLLGAAPGCGGAQGADDCWSRTRIVEAARANAPMRGLVTGVYRGEEEVHDSENFWTKSRPTGRACEVRVSQNGVGQFIAESNLLPTPVVLNIPMSSVDFYMGWVDKDSAFILQQHPGGASAVWTNFNSRGVLNYGHCSEDGYFIRACTPAAAP